MMAGQYASDPATPLWCADRLARNVAFVSGLMESGVEFVAAGGVGQRCYRSSWRIAPPGGSGRLVTRLDTPPFSHRHHPVSAMAHQAHDASMLSSRVAALASDGFGPDGGDLAETDKRVQLLIELAVRNAIDPDRVYVILPDAILTLQGGRAFASPARRRPLPVARRSTRSSPRSRRPGRERGRHRPLRLRQRRRAGRGRDQGAGRPGPQPSRGLRSAAKW
jgi:hypothetical protein